MRHRTMRWAVMLFCVLVCTACGSSTSSPTVTSVPHTSTTTLPSAGTVNATISLDTSSDQYAITVSDTAVWVHNFTAETLLRIDPKTNKMVATIPVGRGPGHVAVESGFVWVLNHDDSTVSKIDPQTNKVVDTIPLPTPNGYLAVSPGAIWLASVGHNMVSRIDPQTDKLVATIFIQSGPGWMSFGAGALWGCGWNGGVWRIDPSINQVVKNYDVAAVQGYQCAGVIALENTVWAEFFQGDGALMGRIDTAANTLGDKAYPLPNNLGPGVVADAHGAWVYGDGGLYHVDSQTNQVVKVVPGKGGGVALGDGSVWFATSDGTLLRITSTN